MKSLDCYNVKKVSKEEASKIIGGDSWLSDLGASAHSGWCSFKGSLEDFASSFKCTGTAGMYK